MTGLAWTAVLAAPCFGSFVGLVAERLPQGAPVLAGRSRCAACTAVLGPAELVPILSWLALGGRCRRCRAPIGLRLPAVELAALAVAAWAAAVVPPGLVWPSCVLGWTLLALALIDLDHWLLPDVLTLPLAAAGLATAAWWTAGWPGDGLIGAVAGGGVLALVAAGYRRLRGRDGLGGGDVKLVAAGGAWLGWQGLPSLILIAALCGLAFGLARGLGRGGGIAARVPFGPPLALALWLVWLYGPLEPAWG